MPLPRETSLQKKGMRNVIDQAILISMSLNQDILSSMSRYIYIPIYNYIGKGLRVNLCRGDAS